MVAYIVALAFFLFATAGAFLVIYGKTNSAKWYGFVFLTTALLMVFGTMVTLLYPANVHVQLG